MAFSFGSIFGFLIFLAILWILVILIEKILIKKEDYKGRNENREKGLIDC